MKQKKVTLEYRPAFTDGQVSIPQGYRIVRLTNLLAAPVGAKDYPIESVLTPEEANQLARNPRIDVTVVPMPE